MAVCAAAGPLSNVAMALLFTVLMKVFTLIVPHLPTTNEIWANALYFTNFVLSLGIIINLSYAVFNLIPIPPLDGSKIVYMFLPTKAYMKVVQLERYIYFVLLGLVVFGVIGSILTFVIFPTLLALSAVFQIDFGTLAMASSSYVELYNELMLILSEVSAGL